MGLRSISRRGMGSPKSRQHQWAAMRDCHCLLQFGQRWCALGYVGATWGPRLNPLSAAGKSQSELNRIVARDVCASANVLSIANAFSAAASAFGAASFDGNAPTIAAPITP